MRSGGGLLVAITQTLTRSNNRERPTNDGGTMNLEEQERYSLVLSLVVLSFLSSPRADVITHTFTGTITFVSGELFGFSPSIGQRVQGSFAYDSSPPPAFDTGAVAGYMHRRPAGCLWHSQGSLFRARTTIISGDPNRAFGPIDNVNGFLTQSGRWGGTVRVQLH